MKAILLITFMSFYHFPQQLFSSPNGTILTVTSSYWWFSTYSHPPKTIKARSSRFRVERSRGHHRRKFDSSKINHELHKIGKNGIRYVITDKFQQQNGAFNKNSTGNFWVLTLVLYLLS